MKLLRITSDRTDGLFDNQLNANLIVEPYSQIALSNASFTNNFSLLSIKEGNNKIIYNTTDDVPGNAKTVTLSSKDYIGTDSDGLILFQNINASLNNSLTLTTSKEWGGEFKIDKINGRITLGYRIAPLTWCGDGENQGDTFQGTFQIDPAENLVPNVVYNLSAGAPAIGTDVNRLVVNSYIVKGAGVFRATLQTLVTNNSLSNGFAMVLSETNSINELQAGNLSAEDESYSIRLVVDEVDNSLFKYTFRNGSGNTADVLDGAGAKIRPQTPTVNADGFANTTNDAVELSVQEGNVVGKIYQTVGGNPLITTAFSVPIDRAFSQNPALLPIVVMKGDSIDCELYNIQINRRQNFNVAPALNIQPQIAENPIYNTGTAVPAQPANRASTFSLDLSNCVDLARFLGFTTGNNFVYTRPNFTRVVTFIGDSNFALSSFESYVVEFMSTQLESYDGMSFRQGAGAGGKLGAGGQYSIIKVIPNYNTNVDNRVCNYEASNLTFIDINNSEPILLRNIKARILDSNLNPINTTEIGVLTIIIKKKDE